MKRKKGFTLVELLAVIVILAILVIIAVPSVIKMLDNTKKKSFAVEAENVIKSAKNAYSNRELNGEEKKLCYTLAELSEYVDKDFTGYTGSVYVDPSTNTYKIWLSKDKYIINGSNAGDMTVVELTQLQPASLTCEDIVILACTSNKYTLSVSAYNGKFSNNSNLLTYELLSGETEEIEEPTREGYEFSGWKLIGAPASFVDDVVTIGEENVTLIAEWVDGTATTHTLYVNPNGGIWDNFTTTQEYEIEEYDTKLLSVPTKPGYIFKEWETTGTPVTFTNNLLRMGTEDVSVKALYDPMYTYSGSSAFIDDGDGNWRIRLLTGGDLVFNIPVTIDAFLVGGGGAGGHKTGVWNNYYKDYLYTGPGGGGGGGFTGTYGPISLLAGHSETITIGGGGEATIAFTYRAEPGGVGGSPTYSINGSWGDGGGAGGNSGGSGNANGNGGALATREFGEAGGDYYAGGGAGGGGSLGGSGGGGGPKQNGTANTGGGGGGSEICWSGEGAGGSGIVVIRNHRP